MEIVVQGVTCHYEQAGQGKPPVLLLHGWGGEIGSFRPLFDSLKSKYFVTAIDFAGHGKSGRPGQEGWSVTQYMEWTVGIIQVLGIMPCDIVAHSFGGRVSILLAAVHPELVRKLVLTGAHGIVGKKTTRQRFRSGFYKVLRNIAGILPGGKKIKAKLADRFGSADYKALDEDMRRTFVKVVNQDLQPYLPMIQASTLLVWGREDTATPLWFGELMQKSIPDAGLVVWDGCGHFAYLERAQQFSVVVDHFLSQEEGT